MADGWNELGSALGGGGALRQAQAYQAGATGTARLETLLAEARRKRDEDMAFSQITPDAIAAGNTPGGSANLLSALLHAGRDPRQFSGYQREALGTDIQRDAYGQVKSGAGIDAVNPLLAVMAGKPVELSNVKDGVSYNPYVTPTNNDFDPTQVGMADIMAARSRAHASDASATASYASANNSNASAARNRAGIGADRAANYDITDDAQGHTVRINKLTGEVTPLMVGDAALVRAMKGGPGSRAPNNDQTNAAGFAERMANSSSELNALEQGGYDPTNLRDRSAAGIGGYLGNSAMSDKGQSYRQAATNWVRANLRKESGAAIGKDEMDQEIDNYFPKAGDTADTVAQKSANRKIVEQNMIRSAGPAWTGIHPAAAPAPTAVAPVAGGAHEVGSVLTINGKQYRVTGGDPNDPDLEPL
jgi:hypothetical protein